MIDIELEQLIEPLLTWFYSHARILPWRSNPYAYNVWVSEIMLQQTRVEAVKPYYERFLSAFPTIEALAEAKEEQLLKMWEGLGYYNRVRNLNKAAIVIQEQHDGRMPDTYEELLKLPGIGSYTAGAIASIAFKRPVPAVDGNVLRILSRVRMDEADILDAKVKKRVETELLRIMPMTNSGDFNQAMMELGACVCIPNGQAKCEECPWRDLCQACAKDCIQDFPKKTKKKARTIEEKTILVLQDAHKVALRKRPARGLLAGMYEFPWIEGIKNQEEVLKHLKENGQKVIHIKPLEEGKHIFTHKEWHMKGYAIKVDELSDFAYPNTILVDTWETEEKYPIPSAFVAYTKYLNIKIGNDKYQN